MYGNLPGLEMCAGDNVMWYTFGLGTEADIHGVYFEGNTFEKQSTTRDTVSLFPHTTAALFMQPNNHGLSFAFIFYNCKSIVKCDLREDNVWTPKPSGPLDLPQ